MMALATALLAIAALVGCSSSKRSPTLDATAKDQLRQALASPAPSSDTADYRKHYSDAITACMKQAGFDYVYWTRPQPDPQTLGVTGEEFARRYGFGISTLIDWHPSGMSLVSPNAKAKSKLSEQGKIAYQKALSACQVDVIKNIGLPPAGTMNNVIPMTDAASDQLVKIATAAENDDRIAKAKKDYLSCMAGKGFHLTNTEMTTDRFYKQAEPFQEAYRNRVKQMVAAGQDPSSLKITDVLNSEQRDTLAKLQRDEITMAVAAYPCLSAMQKIVDAVHKEYEEKFLEGLDK